MGIVKRVDICPSCGRQLRWEPPTFDKPAKWVCPCCHYRRWEGEQKNFWKGWK